MLRKLTQILKKGESGFTLIELMIVILVILILAAILVPQFGLAQERAKKAKCVSNQRNIETAAAMWATDNPNTLYNSGAMNLAATIPNGLTGNVNNLAGTPQYTVTAAFAEPDDTAATGTNGADYFLSGGGAAGSSNSSAPSYGHVICVYAYAAPANPDGWTGASGAVEQGLAGNKFNHARGTTVSP